MCGNIPTVLNMYVITVMILLIEVVVVLLVELIGGNFSRVQMYTERFC